ncbi:hypothetical protein Lal_00007445 [Lupinus albus]|uniref:Putative transcription factor ZF-HD family n=1 Tax=Lupinus albus TaxID=3870 RepID=A0A6A5MUJ5_LUPAL|nr:putative transcription factor ZF-HD family [Lupinus albus]KAF1874830.1 hypothetical protein Lal_00007445 [Lupinus albus]
MRDQDKEIEMPTTLGYSTDISSSKLSSPTVGETSDHQPSPATQTHTLIFNDPPQTSQCHSNLYPLIAITQSEKPSTDPYLSQSPIVITSITTTPVDSIPINPSRTAPPHITAATTTTAAIRYRECLRNHAASMGSHGVDGCGEFMPSGVEGTAESLQCAACDCHRNFHRKEVEGEPQQHASNYQTYHPTKHNNTHNVIPFPPPPPPHHHQQHYHHNHTHLQFHTPPSSMHQHHRFSNGVSTPTSLITPVMMAFRSGGVPTESSSEDLNMFQYNSGQILVQPPTVSKKRFRTKFTQQQKDMMMEFAEKLGWKIQKQDEEEVQQFSSQVGVRRQVFQVWMHNNKQAMKKQQM